MNKNIFRTLLSFVITASFFACSNDDNTNIYLKDNPVQVVSSNLFFDAQAQTGGVRFTAPAGTTVYTTDQWATAELSGDSVTVSVTNNADYESRSAVLTIKNGTDSTNISILQKGAEYQFKGNKVYVINDAAQEVVLPCEHKGIIPTIKVDDKSENTILDKTELSANSVTAHISANTTGEPRIFSLYVKGGEQIDTVVVKQGEIGDFLNKPYAIMGSDLTLMAEAESEADLFKEIHGQLKQDERGNIYFSSGDNAKIPLAFDSRTWSFTIKGGTNVGEQTVDNEQYATVTALWFNGFYSSFSNFLDEVKSSYDSGYLSEDDYQSAYVPAIAMMYNSFATPRLSMSAEMKRIDIKEDKYLVVAFMNDAPNQSYVNGLSELGSFGFTLSKYTADVLGFYNCQVLANNTDFKNPLILNGRKLKVKSAYSMLQNPVLYHVIGDKATNISTRAHTKQLLNRSSRYLSNQKGGVIKLKTFFK